LFDLVRAFAFAFAAQEKGVGVWKRGTEAYARGI
jgi:hypothetical protein